MRHPPAQFRNSKRLSVTFMNEHFGGAMPPLVLITVQKPREKVRASYVSRLGARHNAADRPKCIAAQLA